MEWTGLLTLVFSRGVTLGWTRFMEWKYPVDVVLQNKSVSRGAGVAEAFASL